MNNRIHDAFGSVHAEEALKRSTKAFLEAKESSGVKRDTTRRVVAAFACFALVLFGFGGWKFYMTPVSAISVDVNPSIELGVNRFDRIVSVEGYNEDGIEVAETVAIKNMTYSNGLDTLLQSNAMKTYIDHGGFISVTVIGSNEEKSKEMLARINACAYATGPNVECQFGNREDLSKAHEAGLSFGKYRALLELQALDPSVTADHIQGMTMREIRNRINALSGVQSDTPHGNGAGSEGGGKGRGSGFGQHRGLD